MKVKRYVLKKLALVLSLALVIGVFVFTPVSSSVTVSADSGYYTWSGYSTYLKGAGTEASPFLISSPSDLAYFRKQVATTDATITYYANDDTTTTAKTKAAYTSFYKLTCDIYYNDPNGDEWKSWSDSVTPTNGGGSVHTWAPPGYGDETTRRFEGHFDGNGYTIYGLYIVYADQNCVGFIGTARYATITNLTLSKGYVKGANLVGGFIGQAKAGVDVVNCVSYLRVRGTTGVGGFVGGNAKNGSSTATDVDVTTEATIPSFVVYNSTNKASISGTSYIGGIAGFVSAGASRVQIEKCTNKATITATTSAAGGILGGTRQVDGYGHNLIRNCVNNGKIVGGTGSYAGGIVGCGRATDIYSCVNNGTVNMTGQYAGGISGGNNTGDALANGKIFYCYNTAAITGTTYVGGIVGVAKSVNINMCGNVGNITGTSYVGGISGRSGGTSDKRDTELYDCYNIGSVTSTDSSVSVAGIVGEAYCEGTVSDNKYVKVKRCINLGTVSTGRAIAYSSSTLQNSEGTGLFVYTQYGSTCFGVSGVNANFDGGTAVSSLALPEVLAKLNASSADTWLAGYPFPTLNKIDYSIQNYNGRAELFSGTAVSVSTEPSLSAAVTVNTSGSYYSTISGKGVSYGVLAVKSDALGDDVLIAETAGALICEGSLSGSLFTAVLSGQTVDEYDDMYTFRPYAVFTADGQTVYVYGAETESSYYTAEGAASVPAVNETAAFTCDEKMYLLVGGSDTLEYSLSSASREDSLSFVSSDTSVATVTKGKVKGIASGTATISVTYTGDWGAKTLYCTVTVMDDLTDTVYANQYAAQSSGLRLRTNTLHQVHTSITKNDGFVLDYNGSVLMVDSGHKNDESLKYLKELRAEYLKDGLESGALTEAEYYRRLLSNNCKLEIISLITHWHSDHIHALRYYISKSPMVTIKTMYTLSDPTGTTADGYDSYIQSFEKMTTALATYSPNMEIVRLSYEKSIVRYFGNANAVSTTASDSYPVKVNILAPRDWSTVSAVSGNNTAWENCSSVWYVFEYGDSKLLFTGDTYPNDIGTTYTGASTSGSTAVDYMLYKYSSVVDSTVDFVDCNHHARSSFVENLFTVTQPTIVYAGVYYGQENVTFTKKAVTTADFYLGGDGGHVFVFDTAGNANTDGAICAYPQQSSGRAVRNYLPIHYDLEVTEETSESTTVAATGITLSSESVKLVVGQKSWLSATVSGEDATDKIVTWTVSDTSVVSVDGAYVTALNAGTATVTAACGGYTATCTVTVILAEGDVNEDGYVTTADLMVLKLVLMETIEADEKVMLYGDVDYDDVLTLTDYVLIKKKLFD